MAILNTILETTSKNILTVPPGKSYAITTILICNYSNDKSASFNLHLTPSGETASANNIIVNNLKLPASETFTFDSEKIVIDYGDSVVLNGTPDDGSGNGTTNLSATISYLEV